MKSAFQLALALLLVAGTVSAKQAIRSAREHPVLPLSEDTPRAWHWDDGRRVDENGITLAWYEINMPMNERSPEGAAREFIEQNADKFGGAGLVAGLKLASVRESRGAWHVQFRQTHQDYPVYRGELRIHLNKSHEVHAVNSTLQLIAQMVAAQSPISRARARELAAGLIGGVARRVDVPVQQVVFVDDATGMARSAWVVKYPCADPLGDWELVLDASSGELLHLDNQLMFMDGEGMGYHPDPITTAEAFYGDPGLSDNDDADSPELTAERVPVLLQDISFREGFYRLEGPYVEIVDFEAPAVPPATAATLTGFAFTRSEDGFEDVNAYYHIDSMQRHIQSLGFANLQNGPIQVDTHAMNGQDNSYYSPEFNRIGYGVGGVDDAEDADIIWHEYGHALHQAAAGNEQWSFDIRCLIEGLCDYWAASLSERVSEYQSDRFANWDGHNDFWNGRLITTDSVYPDNWHPLNYYTNGTIWAHALWLMRADLDPDVADAIVAQSLYYTVPGLSATDAALGLLQAEEDLYNGLYHDVVYDALEAKGFVYEAGTLAGTITNELSGDPIPNVEVTLNCFPARTGSSNDLGQYSVELITPGSWEAEFVADGYENETIPVIIDVDQLTQLNVELSPRVATVDVDTLTMHSYIGGEADSSFTLESVSDNLDWIVRAEPVGAPTVEPFEYHGELAPVIPGEGQLYGVTEMDGRYYVSDGTQSGTPKIRVLNQDGQLIRDFYQATDSGVPLWGLASDGEFIYAQDSGFVVRYDSLGTRSIEFMAFDARWITFDPHRNWLWLSDDNGTLNAYELDGDGVRDYQTGMALRGIAFDPGASDGRTLLLITDDTPPEVVPMDPLTGEWGDAIPLSGPTPAEMVGGTVFTGLHPDADYLYFLTTVGDPGEQRLHFRRLRWTVPHLELEPLSGSLGLGQQQTISLTARAGSMDTGLYSSVLRFFFPHGGLPVDVPVEYEITAVAAQETGTPSVPAEFTVSAPAPNPCNAATVLTLTLPHSSRVSLVVFDILGREVDRHAWQLTAGTQRVTWTPAPGLASGVYLLRVEAPGAAPALRKVVVVK